VAFLDIWPWFVPIVVWICLLIHKENTLNEQIWPMLECYSDLYMTKSSGCDILSWLEGMVSRPMSVLGVSMDDKLVWA
jgi:hypothetical protein